MKKHSVLTINQLIKRSFLIPSIVVFIAVFSVLIYFSYKTFQDSQTKNLVNTHAIITRLISPSLLIADSQNVRKVLTLTTQPNQILAIIDNNNDVIMPDYSNLKAVDMMINANKNIDRCSEKSSGYTLNFNNVKYRVFCSFIDYPYGYTVKNPQKHLGVLLSFSKINFFPFSATLCLYLISIVTIIILFLTRWIYISLKKGLLDPFNNFKNYVMNESHEKENLEDIFYTKNAMKEVLEFGQLFERYVEKITEKSSMEKQAAIGRIAMQLAHDIRSPVTAIMMLTQACKEIPEAQRISLREAAERIQDISNLLLTQHGKTEVLSQDYELSPVLTSTAALSVISSKRVEYKHRKINFEFLSDSETYFSFIQANTAEFKRVLSNIINNAVEAISDIDGRILVFFKKNDNKLVVSVTDSGCGMSVEQVKNILSNNRVETNKKDGYGLGLTHTKETLRKFDAKLSIVSELNKGTTVELIFSLIATPIWISHEIIVNPDDCIVILDDDQSIHGAWDELFSGILKQCASLKIMHFTEGDECIHYINSCQYPEKLLLLTDYELIGQEINGLDVIEQVNIQRAILVTSYYENKDVIKRAILLNATILPKILASYVKLTLSNNRVNVDIRPVEADLVLLEDNKEFSEVVAYLYESKGKKINVYHTPYELLNALPSYSKDTKICTDFDLSCLVTGIDIANTLYQKGYHNLYLATGFQFKQNDLPPYITVLNNKMDIKEL